MSSVWITYIKAIQLLSPSGGSQWDGEQTQDVHDSPIGDEYCGSSEGGPVRGCRRKGNVSKAFSLNQAFDG